MRLKYDIQKCFKCSQTRLKNDLLSWKNLPVAKLAMSPKTKSLAQLYANNKGADQTAHLCSLISMFVVCSLASITAKLAVCKISIF